MSSMSTERLAPYKVARYTSVAWINRGVCIRGRGIRWIYVRILIYTPDIPELRRAAERETLRC